jgi:hypothetical protein
MRGSNKEFVFQSIAVLELTAVSTCSCELLFSTIKYSTLNPRSRLTGDNIVYCIIFKASDDRGRMFLLHAGTIHQTTRCHALKYNVCLCCNENLVSIKCNIASGNRMTQTSLP